MHKINLIASAAALAALAGAAGVADAQARRSPAAPAAAAPAAAAPAAAAAPTGPAIPNVCIFSNEATIGQSAVGKYVVSRLQQIQAQVQAELQGEGTTLQNDIRTYGSQRSTLSSDVQQQREKALADRDQALTQKAQLRQKELEATQQKALSRVVSEYNPIVVSVMRTHNCGLVINGQAVMAANNSMDLSPEVVRQLDAKITQFPFEREHLDTGAAAPAAGAAR
jgi:outer membrane protein